MGELLHLSAWGARHSGEEPTTREAVEEVLASDDELWQRFETACGMGVVALRGMVPDVRDALLERGHNFGNHTGEYEEAFATLLSIAEDYFPISPAAVRLRVRERVRDDVKPRGDGGVRIGGTVEVRRAVEIFAAYEDRLFDHLVLAAGSGHARLYAVAEQIRSGLASIGHQYPVELVEDEVWRLVREIAPGSKAAAPDTERQYDLWMRAQRYVEEHDASGTLDEEERQRYEVRALEALRHHDLFGYRSALREMCVAARDAARTAGQDNQGESRAGPAA